MTTKEYLENLGALGKQQLLYQNKKDYSNPDNY